MSFSNKTIRAYPSPFTRVLRSSQQPSFPDINKRLGDIEDSLSQLHRQLRPMIEDKQLQRLDKIAMQSVIASTKINFHSPAQLLTC